MNRRQWWTDERVALLRRRWAAGWSSAMIAASPEFNTATKNAVIGKVHRLKLQAPKTRKRQLPPAPRRHQPKRQAVAFPFLARKRKAPPEARGPVSFAKLEQHHCRWMPGEPETQMYCGATKSPGSSYCPMHTHISWARTAAKDAAAKATAAVA